MPAEFGEAPHSVISTAEDMIARFRPILRSAKIAFVFRTDDQPGEFERAKTQKVSLALQTLVDYEILIWIDQNFWEASSTKVREALILHELYHIGLSTSGGWAIKKHDFGDFAEVVERYGYWNAELSNSLNNPQPKLPGVEDPIFHVADGKVVTVKGEQLDHLADALK
jgi:hypothetical protein